MAVKKNPRRILVIGTIVSVIVLILWWGFLELPRAGTHSCFGDWYSLQNGHWPILLPTICDPRKLQSASEFLHQFVGIICPSFIIFLIFFTVYRRRLKGSR